MRFRAPRNFVVLLSIAFVLSLGSCAGVDVQKLVVSNISPTSVRDGTYQGEQKGNLVTAKVEVVVKDGTIMTIKVLAHRHGPGHGADAMVDRVIAAQSLQVDAVSGATSSSKVMVKAMETALEKGL